MEFFWEAPAVIFLNSARSWMRLEACYVSYARTLRSRSPQWTTLQIPLKLYSAALHGSLPSLPGLADCLCEVVWLGSPIRRKWIQQGSKLQPRWMPPIENRLNEVWSEQGESQDAADVGLVDLLGCGKLRNGSICSLLKHPPPAVGAGYRLHQCAVDARPRGHALVPSGASITLRPPRLHIRSGMSIVSAASRVKVGFFGAAFCPPDRRHTGVVLRICRDGTPILRLASAAAQAARRPRSILTR